MRGGGGVADLHYVKPKPILLKDDPRFNEAWLHERIKDDPSILGLGDLELRDAERIHPKAGRLDILLRDPETSKRYEVEIMLGTVDESHIIRTIEYWDIERKRYPQYEHCAVIAAERITSRFLNVIGLFNGAIPLVAIQLNALQVDDKIILNFTKVLDEVSLGTDDDQDPPGQQVDRAYWEQQAPKDMLKVVDDCLPLLREINPKLTFKYNKFYIGLTDSARSLTFVVFRPRKQWVLVDAHISDEEQWRQRLQEAGLEQRTVSGSILRLRIGKKDFDHNRDLLRDLFKAAAQEYGVDTTVGEGIV